MRSAIISTFFLFLLFANSIFAQQAQVVDTLINMGTHQINFSIIKGKGTPILFESGASNDGTVWKPIIHQIHEITGATIITYDRAGFGKSSINMQNKDLASHGIMAGIQDLEEGLKRLGFNKKIMLISHSYGGYFTYLYASRNPKKVQSIVGIDIVHDYHAEGFAQKLVDRMQAKIDAWETDNLGMYYLLSTLTESAQIMTTLKIPDHIPVVDILMSSNFGSNQEETDRWITCHKNFVDTHPNATGIYAEITDHYIWRDNPSLIINAIVNTYATYSNKKTALAVYKRGLSYATEASNFDHKNAYSENQINTWGYFVLESGDIPQAIAIFELNTKLYPESFNVYDSYGEVLLAADRKEEALAMYKKSVEINPENTNGIKMIAEILK